MMNARRKPLPLAGHAWESGRVEDGPAVVSVCQYLRDIFMAMCEEVLDSTLNEMHEDD